MSRKSGFSHWYKMQLPFQVITDLLEVPTVYKTYARAM